jgi:phage baseplate assembly protein W
MAYYTTRDVETSQKESVRFSDIDLNFDMNPITKDINTLKNEEAVKRSIRNIVLTNFGEKKFQPFFGGDVISQLFESITPFTAFEMEKAISKSIINNEPRVESLAVKANTNNDTNSVNVTVRFTLKNSQQPVILSFTLERTR